MHAISATWRPARPVHNAFTRTLTTRPRHIHPFTASWDPTSATLNRSNELSAEQLTLRDARDYAARKAAIRASQAQKGFSNDEVIGRRYATKRLEDCLSLVYREKSNSKLRAHLWRAYSLAKQFAPEHLDILPDRAWDVLWSSQSIKSYYSQSRRAHLVELYHDMLATGRSPTLQQRITYLDSLCLSGKQEESLKGWQEDYDRAIEGNRGLQPELLQSGCMLHTFCGNVDRAREIMEELYRLYPASDLELMEIVFRAHTRSEVSHHHDIAYEMYLKMKDLLGDKATIQHYDSFLIGFLEARHLSYAKQAFKDVVNNGFLAFKFTPDQVHQVLRRLNLLFRLGTDIAKATSIALHAITVLPQPYHSHLFGEWIKLAVVQKAPEAAAQILEMMFDRGYEPQSFHFNLLLKALFRTQRKQYELKAENIGWHMVDEASKSLPKENGFDSAGHAISANKHIEITKPSDASNSIRKIPPANIATFALLMQRHSKLSQWEHVEFLARRIQELGLQPNADIMNVLMDKQCRQGHYNKSWDIYSSFTNVPNGSKGVFPNGASFRCLWKTLRLALGNPTTREDSTLPSPRKLLAETLGWWELVRCRPDADQFLTGLAADNKGALNHLVMHCFSAVKDLPGQLVAMHALRREFGLFPSSRAGEIIAKQVAWVDMHREAPTIRAQVSYGGTHKRKVDQMEQIYHFIEQMRFSREKITGDQFVYMTGEEKGDLSLNIFSEFIRAILVRQYSPEQVESMIDDAKKEVGLPLLSTGDVDAFSVI